MGDGEVGRGRGGRGRGANQLRRINNVVISLTTFHSSLYVSISSFFSPFSFFLFLLTFAKSSSCFGSISLIVGRSKEKISPSRKDPFRTIDPQTKFFTITFDCREEIKKSTIFNQRANYYPY